MTGRFRRPLYAKISKMLQMPDVHRRLSDIGRDLSDIRPQERAALVKADMALLGRS